MVRKSPTFTILAALSLALGIGANTAIYSFLDAIFLRSLPVEQPEQLAVIQYHTKEFPKVAHGFSGSNFRDANRGMVSGNIPILRMKLSATPTRFSPLSPIPLH
jgi:hypothetical protein